ncbi:permease [Mariniluteicoccus endophyticus]
MSPEPTRTVPQPRASRQAPAWQWVVPVTVLVVLVELMLGREVLARVVPLPEAVNAWLVVVVAICVQAAPFLALGVVVSGLVTALVPAWVLDRIMPRHPALAVPAAGAAGMVLPGCECASVPVSNSLMRQGVAPAAALTFLLAAPAINPIVLVATAVAFPAQPEMVLARFVASLLAALVIGWLWVGLGRREWLGHDDLQAAPSADRWEVFRATSLHDFLHAGGYLVLGAAVTATINVLVPKHILRTLADRPLLAVLTLAVLAVVVSICSEADAFVAASLTMFSPTARLAFMVVSPMVDIKLFAMQWGTFGRAFALRFAPVTLVVCVLCALLVGTLVF